MRQKGSGRQKETYVRALEGKKIPVLTLDNKWYQLLTQEARQEVSGLEEQLNTLLKQQGRLNKQIKGIKRLKKKLMGEIVSMMEEAEGDSDNAQKTEQNKKLVEECNERLEARQDELLDLPKQIEEANFQLMLATMDCCYDTMKENKEMIQETEQWITEIRVELKKRLIRKQEMEQRNQTIYSYMHDVFGAEVIDIFDMQHDSEEMEEQ